MDCPLSTIHVNRMFPYKPSILIGCSWISPQKPSIFGVSPLKKTQSAGSSLPDQCTYLVVLAHAPAAARAGTYGKPRVVTSRFNGLFFLVNQRTNWAYTLWLFNIAMENSSFIDDFPIKTFIYKGFSMAMLNNQMVIEKMITDWLYPLVMTNSLLLNMDFR